MTEEQNEFQRTIHELKKGTVSALDGDAAYGTEGIVYLYARDTAVIRNVADELRDRFSITEPTTAEVADGTSGSTALKCHSITVNSDKGIDFKETFGGLDGVNIATSPRDLARQVRSSGSPGM